MKEYSIRRHLVLLAAMLALALLAAVPALAQTEGTTEETSEPATEETSEPRSEPKAEPQTEPDGGDGVRGLVTDISGAVALVEEDPSAESGGKGYFTVTGETDISGLLGGDAVAPATFEDLAVGQQVEATYAGPVQESYPSQGEAASITILEGFPGDGDPPPGEVVATGVIGALADFPGASHGITDQQTGAFYGLRSDTVDLDAYAADGERVTVRGVPVPGSGSPNRLLNVTRIDPADGSGGPTDRSATLSFELTVEGEPPAGAMFFGAVPAEGCISEPLTDSDGDGAYTGSVRVPRFAPGPVRPDTQPVSLPVQIVQAGGGTSPCDPARVIEDFGSVLIDDDKSFESSVSFHGDDGGPGGGGEVPFDECEALSPTPELCPGGSGSGGSSDGGSGSGSSDSGSGGGSGSGGSGSGGSGGGSGGSSGGTGGITGLLPSTGGGAALTVLGVGGVLILGGLLVRKLVTVM